VREVERKERRERERERFHQQKWQDIKVHTAQNFFLWRCLIRIIAILERESERGRMRVLIARSSTGEEKGAFFHYAASLMNF
jgi:hypothetical protein